MEQNRERLFLCCSNYKWKITYSAEQVELPSWIEWSIVLMFYVMAWFILIISSLHYFFPPQKALFGILLYRSKSIFGSAKNGILWGELPQEKCPPHPKISFPYRKFLSYDGILFVTEFHYGWVTDCWWLNHSRLCAMVVFGHWNSAEQINSEKGGCCMRKWRERRNGRSKRLRKQKQ